MKNFNIKLLFFVFPALLCANFLFVDVSSCFAKTIITEDIISDTAWTTSGSPYIVENDILISTNTTLSIEPGVIVKFNNTMITVFGNLVANGELNNKIYFTSYYDDNLGGDSNEDYVCLPNFDDEGNQLEDVCDSLSLPTKDDWSGFNFFDSHSNSLNNVVIKYSNDFSYLDHSYLNLKNIEFFESNSNIFANTSNLDIDKTNCENLSGTCLYAINSSNVNWTNSLIDKINGDAIYVFDSSTLNLSNFSIKNIYNSSAIYVFRDSFLNAEKLNIENITGDNNYGINIFNNSHFTFNNSSIKNCPGGACIVFYDWDEYIPKSSSINITNTILDGGLGSGILTYGDSNILAKIENSIIKNFSSFSIENYASFIINAKNNWWGNDTGPYQINQNPIGTAGSIFNPFSDNVDFIPWCMNEACNTRNPVILIPGITGTYLNKNYDDKKEIWPNISKMFLSKDDEYLNELSLNVDGTEKTEYPIIVGDIIRGISTVHVFDDLISELESNGEYIEGKDLFVFPYDWRKSTLENSILLKEKIGQIILETKMEKVDIVAHSMGGLLVKKYIADNKENKIDKLIFLGTPQLGAPKAFKVLMFGDNMGYGIKITDTKNIKILNSTTAKNMSQNMPSVYELLPSKKYVENSGNYVVNSIDKNNPTYLDYLSTKDYLIEKGRNILMFPFAESLHDSIDNLDLSNINTHTFVGCGTKTIGEIIVKQKHLWNSSFFKWFDDFDLKYVNGDETVPLASADKAIGSKLYYAKNDTHGSLPSADGVKQNVLRILKGENLQNFSNILSDTSNCNISGKVVSVHSPVELHVYDEMGNHTGPNIDGDIEENIPGVQYDVIEGEKFAFLTDGKNYKIITNATDTGGYSFQIKNEDKNDIITNSFDWTLIPLETLQAQGEIMVGPDYPESDYEIKMDQDGDGSTDKTYPISFDGTSIAEESINSKKVSLNNSSRNRNEKIVTNIQEIEPIVIIEKIEEKKLPNIITSKNFNNINKNIFKNKETTEISLIASINKTGVKFNKIWFIIIGVGLIAGLLFKKFIKI